MRPWDCPINRESQGKIVRLKRTAIDFWVKRYLVSIQKVNEMWYVWDTAENGKNLHKDDFCHSHVVLSPMSETINYNQKCTIWWEKLVQRNAAGDIFRRLLSVWGGATGYCSNYYENQSNKLLIILNQSTYCYLFTSISNKTNKLREPWSTKISQKSSITCYYQSDFSSNDTKGENERAFMRLYTMLWTFQTYFTSSRFS